MLASSLLLVYSVVLHQPPAPSPAPLAPRPKAHSRTRFKPKRFQNNEGLHTWASYLGLHTRLRPARVLGALPLTHSVIFVSELKDTRMPPF